MTYFLQDVARYLYDHCRGDLRNVVVVFPNRRARLFFNHFLSELTDKPLWAPQYYTISDFIQQLSRLTLSDPLTLVFRLFKVFQEVTHSKESFDSFYFYSEMILADFDDIDKYRVSAGQLFMNLSDLKALEDYYQYLDEKQLKTLREFWEIINKAGNSDEKQEFISIWDALHRIYEKFNAELTGEGIAYEGKAYREAISLLGEGDSELFNGKQVAFVGFNALNHCEELLFEHFRKLRLALFFWDYDKSYTENEYHEAGFFLRRYLKRFPQPNDFIADPGRSSRKQKIMTISVPSPVSQAKSIAQCIGLLEVLPESDPLQTALILADENLLIPVINSLPPELRKINISMGYPLTDTPVFSFVMLLAGLQMRRQLNRKDGKPAFLSRDMLSIFSHDLLSGSIEKDKLQVFKKHIADHNLVYLRPEDIPFREQLPDLIITIPEGPKEFIIYLRQVLEFVAGKLGDSPARSNMVLWQMETLQIIHRILLRLEALSGELPADLSFGTMVSLLRKIAGSTNVAFRGEPLDGLQVLGVLETRTLDFKNLIIISMNEGSFPKTGHAPSFIPFALREGFGLPTIRHQDSIFSYYFYRLLHRTENLLLIYHTKTEGISKGEPSRFIRQLQYEREPKPDKIDMTYRISSYPGKTITAEKSSEVLKKLEKYLEGKSFLSPSAINTYMGCRLKFFFRYIEEMKEPEEATDALEADVFGSILHKAMFLLYENFRHRTIEQPALRSLRHNKELVSSVIDRSFSEEFFRQPAQRPEYKGRNLIIRKVMHTYIDSIMHYDELQTPFRIEALEEKIACPVHVETIGREVQIGGIIDRVDLKDGTTRVIDYKTGKRESEFHDISSLFSQQAGTSRNAIFQSFLYAWMLKKKDGRMPVQPCLYFIRDILKPGFSPFIHMGSKGKVTVKDIGEFNTEFEGELKKLLNEMFSKDISFTQTEDEKSCRYCPYQKICCRGTDS